MGEVALSFRVMPEDAGENIDHIKNEISKLGAKEIKITPLAFGLKCVEVLFVVSDKQGGDFEEKLSSIKGVGSVESTGVTLV